jgi:putative phosphoesterase
VNERVRESAPPLWRALLPVELPAAGVAARWGLISDTHMPERCPAIPSSLDRVFDGVDLILHAGDLGALSVLDRLGAIAPVVAVHGNDDTPEAQRALPYQQVIAAAGQRVLLCHTHHPDPADEEAWRRSSHPPGAAFARRAEMGRRAGAGIVVYGHSHVPVVAEHEGVWLVNPGAIAPANPVTRMRYQTVALLYLRKYGAPFVVHVDLAAPDRPFAPAFWMEHGRRGPVNVMVPHFTESILEPELTPRWLRAWEQVRVMPAEERRAVNALLCRLAYPCWSGERQQVTLAEAVGAFRGEAALPLATREVILRALGA